MYAHQGILFSWIRSFLVARLSWFVSGLEAREPTRAFISSWQPSFLGWHRFGRWGNPPGLHPHLFGHHFFSAGCYYGQVCKHLLSPFDQLSPVQPLLIPVATFMMWLSNVVCNPTTSHFKLSYVWVAIDGDWIDNHICWPITTCNYN
jgi:hypothetical protein